VIKKRQEEYNLKYIFTIIYFYIIYIIGRSTYFYKDG